jgi:hypothetical protein
MVEIEVSAPIPAAADIVATADGLWLKAVAWLHFQCSHAVQCHYLHLRGGSWLGT